MYMSNIVAIAYREAQPNVEKAHENKGNKYDYHVNASHAIGTLKDCFIMAVLESNRWRRRNHSEKILRLLAEHVVPTRPGRSIPRNPIPRKAKYKHNKKQNC